MKPTYRTQTLEEAKVIFENAWLFYKIAAGRKEVSDKDYDWLAVASQQMYDKRPCKLSATLSQAVVKSAEHLWANKK